MTTDGPLSNTPAEDTMVRNLRLLGADDAQRQALTQLVATGWTANEITALARDAAAGRIQPPTGGES